MWLPKWAQHLLIYEQMALTLADVQCAHMHANEKKKNKPNKPHVVKESSHHYCYYYYLYSWHVATCNHTFFSYGAIRVAQYHFKINANDYGKKKNVCVCARVFEEKENSKQKI